MENEKLKKLSLNLVADKENYMSAFRKNIDMYIAEKDITIREVAEVADISFDTLKTFIYGDSKDCKLSTAVKLARAFNVSIDELVGAETMNSIVRENVAKCRNLPDAQLYLIRYLIENQVSMLNKNKVNGDKFISIMRPKCQNGNLEATNVFEPMCIDHMPDNVKSKVFVGIMISCDHYMPYYSPYDVLLLGADRKAQNKEHCVIVYFNRLFVVERVITKDFDGYVGFINKDFKVTEKEIDRFVGYVVASGNYLEG